LLRVLPSRHQPYGVLRLPPVWHPPLGPDVWAREAVPLPDQSNGLCCSFGDCVLTANG